jgi:hypothetical protein
MHLGVLRVLTEQTLEISSVVKDPTQPGPSLVTEVKDPSLTILHQFYLSYRWILQQLQAQRETVHISEGFQQKGALEELVPFDLEEWRSFRGPHPLGFDYWV